MVVWLKGCNNKKEDGIAIASTSSDTKSEKMVATNINTAARKAILEERKKQIEEKLVKFNHDLKQLCIQEAELTGITPSEMPLEYGENPPTIRRKVMTAYQLNENLLNSNKDQLIAHLELELQLHKNLRDAALGLSEDRNMRKTVKRHHRAEYAKHKHIVKTLEDKLIVLKDKAAAEQIMLQNKKSKMEQQDDNISIMTNETYLKQETKNSQTSSKHSLNMLSPADTYPEPRYPSANSSRQMHYNRNSENLHFLYPKAEEELTSGFYRLSVNACNDYIDRQDSMPHYNYQPQNLLYNNAHASYNQQLLMHQMTYPQQHSPSSGSPQMAQHTAHVLQPGQYVSYQIPNYSQLNPKISQHSPGSQHSPISQHSPQMRRDSPQLPHSPLSQHSLAMQRASQNYSRMSQQYVPIRQSSPTMSTGSNAKVQYYAAHHTSYAEPAFNRFTGDGSTTYRNTVDAGAFKSPHPLQPHQQYENNGMHPGLGGCWKRSESGELFWVYSSNTLDSSWQRDKRFGSLDRRRNKRVQRKISPVDSKSATLATMPAHNDQVKTAFVKPPQVTTRRSQDHRQLVRTQSLGSVGQTIDSVYPSDDTSSCESDNRSFKENAGVRKHKEKEWLETSLDGPISPTHSIISRPQSTVPTTLAPEEKYISHTPPPPPLHRSPALSPHSSPSLHSIPFQNVSHHVAHPLQSPLSPKPLLEIPAESNPSPRVPEPPNMELLNNNILRNCTVVQAGVVKPYHEETKPFEMSDFYKYSTKFKKSPQKESGRNLNLSQVSSEIICQKNLSENFEDARNMNNWHPGRVPQRYIQHNPAKESTQTSSLNNSFELSPVAVSEQFSEEMNTWYENKEQENDNNNTRPSQSRSGATLV
ncbi:unnamed protein product [Ceutorhynchus assimilis]|uniref:Cytohesin Ubiquitin Protein Inducing domain-containing protein n=1 Tax=Ceutorhynchus assimilis TaxID=467358 RepID=A0A9N9QHX5_9CUCU|nr:unnamed protein product [Ceutorhynchus assimilis]